MTHSPYAQVGAKLVERGYSCIPILPNSKRPGHIVGGEWRGMHDWQARYSQRLPTNFEIAHWETMPDAGVCVVTGKLVPIDIDVDDKDIIAAIEACLPPTPAIKVGAKGKTLFFRGSCPSVSFNEYLPDGTRGRRLCDLLGHGRQTVLPPTIHPDTGRPYQWIGHKALQDLDFDELPELPDNAAELIAEALKPFGYRPEINYPTLNGECRGESDSPFRALNNMALEKLDAWVPRLGLARCRRTRIGYVAVAEWRSSHSGRPLEKRGLNLKIHPDGIRDFHDGPRSYTPLDLVMEACGLQHDFSMAFVRLSEWLGRVPDNIMLTENKLDLVNGSIIDTNTGEIMEAASEPEDANDFLDADLMLPGYLGEIAEWILSTSLNPIRLFATTAALSVVGTLVARRVYCSAPRLGTNLYMLMVAGTGGGKEHPLACVKRLLDAVGAQGLHMSDVASSSSLSMRLSESPVTLQIVDEIDRVFRKVSGKFSSNHETDLMQAYNSLWGVGISSFTPSRTTLRSSDPIERPCLSILGTSTPLAFFEHLKSKMLSGGFLNRFLVLPRHQRVADNLDILPNEFLPESLIATGKRLFGFQDIKPDNVVTAHWIAPTHGLQNPKNPPPMHIVELSPRADAMRADIMADRRRKLIESDKDSFLEAWTRYADMVQRVALIVACGRTADDGLRGCMIEESDMAFANRLVEWSISGFVRGLRENMSENEHQANSKLVLRHIKNVGGKVKRGELLRYLGGRIETRQLDGILRQLVDGEQITEIHMKPAGAGRPGVIYSAIKS